MNIILNGESVNIEENISISGLLESRGVSVSSAVVEYNGNIIPKDKFDDTVIESDAVIEVLSFVGGG